MNARKPKKQDPVASFMTFDEYGRPFIIMREQAEKEQISGTEVIKVIKKYFVVIDIISWSSKYKKRF